MAGKATALPTAATVRQGRELDLAGERIDPENRPNLRERQAAYVERRFMLPAAIARTVAEIHFAEGPA